MAAKLTERQKRFCDEYLIDLNATQAAIRAGYSEKTAQNIWKENLTKPYIKKRIEARIAEKESQLIATQDVVLRYLTSVMRSKSTASLLPSCGVGVQHVIAKHPDEKISIHAPRGGCDPYRTMQDWEAGNFNPRTPRGVRRMHHLRLSRGDAISIHAPRGGCDEWIYTNAEIGYISIHAPRGGCDGQCVGGRCHALYFNPRTPRGVRRVPVRGTGIVGSISIHAPRGGCDSKTVHFLAHFADIRRKKSHIFRKTKRRFILIGRKCCFLTLFRVRTSREIPVRLHFAAYTRSVSVGK